MAWRNRELRSSATAADGSLRGHGASGMLDARRPGCGMLCGARITVHRGKRGGRRRHVSAVMPSRFLAGVGGKYTSLRTIWLSHVERRAQPCRAGAGAACASAGARGQRRAQVPLPRFSLRFRPKAGVRCSPPNPAPHLRGQRAGRGIAAAPCLLGWPPAHVLSAPCQPS